jgi:hypothetical protein
LLCKGVDWRHLALAAEAHGLLAAVYLHLRAWSGIIPERSIRQFRSRFCGNAVRSRWLTGELITLLERFAAHGIRAVPFKGPALAAELYAGVNLREFSDLDILIPRRQVRAAGLLLRSQGYRPLSTEQGKLEAEWRFSHNHVYAKGDLVVELHWAIANRAFSLDCDYPSLWHRLRPLKLGGIEIMSLAPEDLLICLCVHGARHCWSRLAWVRDIAELVRRHPKLDWDSALTRARE